MPTFKYKTRVKGKIEEGEIEAEDEKTATAKLKQKNIRPTSIKKKGGGSLFGPAKQKTTPHRRNPLFFQA